MSILSELLDSPSLHSLCASAVQRAELRAKLMPSATSREVPADLRICEGETSVFDEQRVHVAGNLILEDQARLLVAGDLVVEGSIIHEGFDYALLFAGGSIEASDLLFAGELVALDHIAVRSVAWTYYNDHSTYADALTARLVVADDRCDAVDAIHAETHLVGHARHIAPALAKLLRAELLDAEGGWSYRDLAQRLLAGEALLRH